MTSTKKLPFEPGTAVAIDGAVRGTFIGVAASGKYIIDLGYGTTLADSTRIEALA